MSTPTAAQPAGRTVDLNADLGEGLGVWRLTDDDGLLDVVSSANVACGAHAGDPTHMRRVCRRAAERGVAVGAQVSYPDLLGFGRRFVDIDPAELEDSVLYQLSALQGVARAEGTQVRYVKPHGALYNAVVTHEAQAAAVVAAVVAGAPGTAVLGLPGAVWLEQAEAAGARGLRRPRVHGPRHARPPRRSRRRRARRHPPRCRHRAPGPRRPRRRRGARRPLRLSR